MQTLIDSFSKIIIINLDIAKNFGLQVWYINIDTQKINRSKLHTFGMVLTSFSIENKEIRSYFFIKTFLIVNLSIDISLEILFFTLSNFKLILFISTSS